MQILSDGTSTTCCAGAESSGRELSSMYDNLNRRCDRNVSKIAENLEVFVETSQTYQDLKRCPTLFSGVRHKMGKGTFPYIVDDSVMSPSYMENPLGPGGLL